MRRFTKVQKLFFCKESAMTSVGAATTDIVLSYHHKGDPTMESGAFGRRRKATFTHWLIGGVKMHTFCTVLLLRHSCFAVRSQSENGFHSYQSERTSEGP